MGSKSRIKKHIVPIIQDYIDKNKIENYVEFFVGGANIIDSIRCKNKYGLDKQSYLIALMKNIHRLKELPKNITREHYNDVRESYKSQSSKYEDWYVGAIGFLASYNGRFFDGGYAKSGYEKTKKGERFRDYYNESKSNLIEQSEKLKDIRFGVQDFFNVNVNKLYNYVIYLDPPYQNTKQYKTSVDFDHTIFWDKVRELSKNNIVIISEENAPDDFMIIWEKTVSRSIKATSKSLSTEKLYMHKECIE